MQYHKKSPIYILTKFFLCFSNLSFPFVYFVLFVIFSFTSILWHYSFYRPNRQFGLWILPCCFICYSNNSFRTCWWTELLFLPFLNKSTKLTRTPCPLLYILLLQDVPTHCLFSISLFHNIFFSLFSLFSSSYVPISYPKRFTFHSPSSHNKFLFKFNSFFVVIFKSSLSKSQWKNNEFPWNWILLDLVQFTTHF